MARKKILFVIVEGPSDDTAIGAIFTKLYDRQSVYIEITHGDITSDTDLDPVHVIDKVAELVKSYAESNHYESLHFHQIIHLLDTDGTYIPDSNVIQDNTVDGTMYSETEIRTNNRDGILRRNARKRSAMNKLSRRKRIWNIPYSAYYMSSNLDHVLYNIQNSSDDEKEANAYFFAKKYRNDIHGFLKFISESGFSVCGEYRNSWEYIQEGLHSLERHTNLGLCFSEFMN